MKFLSLFSGVEAASVAWEPLGWTCVGFAEIDKFACSLLKHRYPKVPNLGDVTQITEDQISALGHIDVVIFGFPCQDLSVAGKRAGLKGERSGLFFDAIRIVRWSRARWAIAENVPGLFSSNGGQDFAAVVGEMAGIRIDIPDGGWRNAGFLLGADGLVEWAVLDAQFFGVPQRRRRVFLVRDIGDWRSRPPLLLERHSLSGYPAPSRETGKRVAPCLDARTDGGGAGWGTDFMAGGGLAESPIPDVAWALQERDAKGQDSDTKEGHLIPMTCPPLRAGDHKSGGVRPPGTDVDSGSIIPIAFSAKDSEPNADVISPPLRSMNNADSHANGGGQVAVAFAIQERAVSENAENGPDACGVRDDGQSYTLEARSTPQAVAFKPSHFTRDKDGAPSTVFPPLSADADKGDQDPVVLTFESRCARNGRGAPSEIVPPLKAQSGESGKGDAAPLIAFEPRYYADGRMRPGGAPSETVGTLNYSPKAGDTAPHVATAMAVRRLLPVETERLQGFPDNWTKISEKTADGPRYRAIGNSMAVPVVRWIGERLQMVEDLRECDHCGGTGEICYSSTSYGPCPKCISALSKVRQQ